MDWTTGPPEALTEGMLVEFRRGEAQQMLLVGHVNALGGVCDDCVELRLEDVARWKWVWGATAEDLEQLRVSCESGGPWSCGAAS